MDAGDLNGDGKLDAAVCGESHIAGDSVVTVMLGDGAGGFTNSTFSVDDLPSSVKIGDMNNDGIPDIVVAGALPGNTTGNYISTFLGNGRGVFALAQTLNLGQGNLKGDIAIGDFDEDGNLDVAFPKTGLRYSTTIALISHFLRRRSWTLVGRTDFDCWRGTSHRHCRRC